MTPIEIIALIVIIFSFLKIITLLVSPSSWMKFARSFFRNQKWTMFVSLIFALAILYFLLAELSIVQILAVTGFVAFIAAMSFSIYAKEIFPSLEKIVKEKKFFRKAWLPVIVWLILMIWGIKALL